MADQPAGGKQNPLTRKIGPLPTWAWVAIVAAVILAWAVYKNRQAAKTPPPATAGAGQVPQFVNQTYESPEPPEPGPPPPRRKPHHRRDRDHDRDDDGSRHHREVSYPGGRQGGPPRRPVPFPGRRDSDDSGPGRDRRGQVSGVTGG